MAAWGILLQLPARQDLVGLDNQVTSFVVPLGLSMKTSIAFSGILILAAAAAPASADWPMYAGDAARTGSSTETLTTPLHLAWTFRSTHAPMPAWPSSDRQTFDRVMHPVVSGNTLYFGSSVDCSVRALDTRTGRLRWTFFTGGPIRFAPALWQDRVLAASDDGYLYCLSSDDGRVLWKHCGATLADGTSAHGAREQWILGNDRLISRWPARGGPVVVDDIVYYGAGIWPSEGIFLHALDATTGKVRWTNDKSGAIYMGQPHGGANALSGVSAQGYLVATGEELLVSTGRAVPAVFNRADGKFKYFHLQLYGHKGGATTLASGQLFVNAGLSFETKTGNLLDPVGAGPVAAYDGGLLVGTARGVNAFRQLPREKRDRLGKLIRYEGLEKSWTVDGVPAGAALIVAGRTIISSDLKSVAAIDLASREVLWTHAVDGVPGGLAVADGRLFVSTNKGVIQCFAVVKSDPVEVTDKRDASPYENAAASDAARTILRESGIAEGYCVDLGCGDGALAFELARQSKLQIIAIDADARNVQEARARLIAAGLYGVRVTVLQGEPTRTPLPKHIANLVVSHHSMAGADMPDRAEVSRLQRPYGGVVCLGNPAKLQKHVRGPLLGAGSWTHQYADAANTCCSSDSVVSSDLGMLWFRDSDFPMPQRHGRGPAPLFHEGRLIVEGLHGLRAVDAYNGRGLWEYPLENILKPHDGNHLMGTAGTNSNYCLADGSVYVAVGNRCLRIDAATGQKLGEFTAPAANADEKARKWGYIACQDGTLYGSGVDDAHIVKFPYGRADMTQQFTESRFFFALDALSGKVKWTWTPRHSLRHNAIAIGGGRVFLIDRPLAEMDRLGFPKDEVKEHVKGTLLALDAGTGKTLWQSEDNIYGTMLALSVPHSVLLMSYQSTRFKLPSEQGKWLTGFHAAKGDRLWETTGSYTTRPVLIDRTIYAQGGAWDVLDGTSRPFAFKRSYGCGQIAASKSLMVFRSATLSFFDLDENKNVEDYGGIRPGCWINSIPAGGVVLVPDASSGCQCSYLNQAWIALQARD